MPVNISLIESIFQGSAHITELPFSRRRNVNVPHYPSVRIITIKNFDAETDSETFDEILIMEMDLEVNGTRIRYLRNIRQEEPESNITVDKIIDDYNTFTNNNLQRPFNFRIIAKDNFEQEWFSNIIQIQ